MDVLGARSPGTAIRGHDHEPGYPEASDAEYEVQRGGHASPPSSRHRTV